MNEIETFGRISLVNADCLEVMATLPDNAFDLAIVDPPYGIGIDGQKACICKNPKHNRKHHDTKGWDKLPPPIYFAELQRVSKNQIIWGANYFVPMLDKGTKGWIVWFKGQTGLTMSDCELAYSSFDCPTRVVTINRCELAKQHTIHPTEKPKSHLGSGSICLAAHDLNFEMLGIELDAGYYQAAKQRLLYHQQQLKLF